MIFQFLYGTIKTEVAYEISEVQQYFNSCMVRLRPMASAIAYTIRTKFQFLYGTIKT